MRYISLLLAAAMLLSLTGCNTQQPEETQPVILQSATGSTTVEGVEIGLTGIKRTAGDTVLQITWKNSTPYRVLYGEVFWLQILKDGQWESMTAKENTGFHTVGYMLEPRSTTIKNYTTAWLYGTLQPGTYRFLTDCTVYETEEGRTCDLYVEFTLGTLPDETVKPDNSHAESPYKLPPMLQITIGNANKELTANTYAWTYTTADGGTNVAVADAPHPLESMDSLVLYETTNFEAYIDFNDWPDDITIRCWPDSQFGNPNAESEDMTIGKTNRFTLKPATSGGYIYEIICQWNDDGDPYHGTASYYLYIASYPVMPIQPRN